MKWSLLLFSDLHFSERDDNISMREAHRLNMGMVVNLKQDKGLQMVVSCGDLTEHGYGGNQCCGLQRQPNELEALVNKFVLPLENIGLDVLLGPGNHDTYVKFPYINKPVLKYIRDKYDTTYSLFDQNKSNCYVKVVNGIRFISMGIYPKNVKWLRKHLCGGPIIIFFHYNFVKDEPFSEWWSQAEKDKFFETIENYNVIAIFHGHHHTTTKQTWRGIDVYNGSGKDGSLLLEFEDQNIISHQTITPK